MTFDIDLNAVANVVDGKQVPLYHLKFSFEQYDVYLCEVSNTMFLLQDGHVVDSINILRETINDYYKWINDWLDKAIIESVNTIIKLDDIAEQQLRKQTKR